MAPVSRVLLPVISATLVVAALASCSPAAPQPSGASREFVASTLEEQTGRLAEVERELDALLAAEVGLDAATGMTPAEAAETLPRRERGAAAKADAGPGGAPGRPGATRVAPAEYPVPQPDAEQIGAAANSLSLLHEIVRESLGEASLNQANGSTASHSTGKGKNPAIEWNVEKGHATGQFTSSISDTNDNGDKVTVALEGMFELAVCPDPDGTAEGAFFTSAAVTFTPSGGATTRTVVDVDMETIAHVGDDAHTYELWASVDSALSTGAPGADSATRVPEPHTFRREENAYAFEFGEDGAADRGALTADQQLDGAFSAQVDDLAEQIALLLARAGEDYWRDGNCIDVQVEGEEVTPQPGDKQQLWVDAISVVDGEKITRGTVEVIDILGDSTINPMGLQPIAEADYQFIAGQEFGKADPTFEIVSRRGIGRGGPGITVIGDTWSLSGSFGGAEYTGYSCTGLQGPWTIHGEADGWEMDDEVTFGDDLRGTSHGEARAGGQVFPGTNQLWLTEAENVYIMHVDTGASYRVRQGAVDECE